MNSVNMTGMNPMSGGPVGGGMPTMMNNGAAGRAPMPVNDNQRSQLNTYIYEYFLRNEMYDCARSLLRSDQPMNVLKTNEGKMNGDDGANGDSKDDIDSKQPEDLPPPNLPKECPESCFLYEWWCLFWDMFNAQRGKADGRAVMNYVAHTQAQSRQRQEQQVAMLRGLRPEGMMQNGGAYQQMMMRNQANGMNMHQQNELRQKAIQNRQNAYRPISLTSIESHSNLYRRTPQQAQMLAQQKQNQMQRDPSDGNNQQRAQSPASAENAPSPSKRPRLDGNTPFNPSQMQNGRGQQAPGMPQQFQVPGGPNAQATRAYQAGLAQQQAGQMPINKMPNQGPQSQGSPMMPQGADGSNVANFYNPGTDMGGMGRGGPNGGQGGNAAGNHALQDYQMQLMLLEQQNKKRLMMARQEQDNMTMPRADGAPGAPAMGANGQPFQGTSPQGARNSPNPSEQMKRTPHMGQSNIPSPLPDGQTRSPSGMNFNNMGQGNPMDPNMAQKGFYPGMNGMDQNMVAAGMQNGMRPPSSHPGGAFNNPMAQQQMQMQQQRQQAAQQQAQQQGGQNWNGPGGPMAAQPNQGGPQQMGTPRQNTMPPPSAPATGAAVNGRTQPPSPQQGTAAPPTPQQGNKANPKKKTETKDAKAKRAAKKVSAPNLNAGATPSADAPTDGPTPTPQTPITPHTKSFAPQNGAAQPVANGQPPAPPANANVAASQQPDAISGFTGLDNPYEYNMGFADPQLGNSDVLQDFDFDSFLHQDGDVDNFNFDTGFSMEDGGQIGAE
ncbi:hypothetical protein HYFRA_00000289 [Hymenoscyphus fraxineus]|uniref:LisH domain-containing protein n=1 Tax=Hymenoscyphus fraxineus TaxID=746836 RepID=A0A9N9L5K7_9HELO|nr:hypothetical protein HYFRA_00000289 [Hymenoscyphus fraxineus]